MPGSIVFAAKPHNRTSNPSPIHIRARDPGAKFILPIPGASNLWCTGEDSNLRSSKERQIYSLLPLTARPPVHNQNSKRHDRTAALRRRFPAQTSTKGARTSVWNDCGGRLCAPLNSVAGDRFPVHLAGVAQLVEHLICNQTVGGSSPFASSRIPGLASSVSFDWREPSAVIPSDSVLKKPERF